MATIAAGYEPEANGFKRTLTDAHSRACRIVADDSGEYARQWLAGRAGKPAAAVAPWAPDGLWEMLSHSSHADHRAVENFLAISEPDGTVRFIAHPERRPELANPTLAVFAGETRDLANLIARERGLEVPGLAELDALIAQHFPSAEAEGPAADAGPAEAG